MAWRQEVDARDREMETLMAEVTILAAHISAATYRFLMLLRRLDQIVSWAGEGIASAAHWLNFRCGMNLRTAQEHVRVAHALATLPRISAAFAKGELSFSKVRAMTRVATPANEDYLLNFARSGTAWHVEQLVRKYRRCERTREIAEARAQHSKRALQWWYDADGSLVFRGRLPADMGGLLVAALQAARAEIDRRDEPVADAVAPAAEDFHRETVDERSAERTDAVATPPWVPEEHEPHETRRADALALLAESFLAHGAAPLAGGERYLLHVHVDEAALPENGNGTRCHLDEGPAIAGETARRIACDCSRVCIHEDASGEVLSVGRKTRQIPPAIRRALRSRDGGCQFLGCTNRRFVESHHVRHWADGGETSLENLVTLCRLHHRLVHEGGYAVAITETGLDFVDPRGRVLRCSPFAVEGDAVAALASAHENAGIRIDSETIRPHGWYGEPVLWGWAIDALIERDVSARSDPALPPAT